LANETGSSAAVLTVKNLIPPPMMKHPLIGNTLTHYRVTARLGEGGMGAVYRATDTKLGREVAIKVLPLDVERDNQAVSRFEREAKVLAALNHPHIASIYGFEADQGIHFLVLELIEGETLAERLKRGRLSVDEALRLARQIAEAVEVAHAKGIVHRDLKPGNIKITPEGRVKVLDFGLAKAIEPADEPSIASRDSQDVTVMAVTTLPGMVMGTPAYMSPEQARGQEVDKRTDVWAFGCCLFECLAGMKPFRGETVTDLMASVLRSEPEWGALAAETPREVVALLKRCLEKEPRRRLSSLGDIAILLEDSTQVLSSDVRTHKAEIEKSLAVLPFLNMSDDRENEFLSDGITEDLIMAVSRVKGLRVPARTSSFAFKGKQEDIRRIAQLLNVEAVLEGSVRRSGNKLRVTAQLVKAQDGCHLWSERYDREMKDVFDIQDEITRAIVSALQVRLTGSAETQFVRRQTSSTEAYELYVKGRVFWNQRANGLMKALHYFELALLEDPNYAPAWAGVADAYNLMGFYDLIPFREALAKAKLAAQKALAQDDQSAEAHSSTAWVLHLYDWNLPAAEREYLRALELNPNYTPARYWYASTLMAMGRSEESIAQDQRAVEGDPLSFSAHTHLGWMFVNLRQFKRALAPLRRSLELNPNFPIGHWLLGQACWATGQREEALAELSRAAELSGRMSHILSSLGWALAQSGQTEQAREIQRELAARRGPTVSTSLGLVKLYAAFGENDAAFAALDQSLEDRDPWISWIANMRTMVEFFSLESDPRWPTFVEKVQNALRAGASG
jgi:serine/threonine protein kinase/tetratricopeptide (TPR) repeat protein